MKAHITLTEPVRRDPEGKRNALERLRAEGIGEVNLGRFERYGIVTAEVPPDRLERIRKLDFVHSVNADGVQRALGDAKARPKSA